jgi:hypothetical protein
VFGNRFHLALALTDFKVYKPLIFKVLKKFDPEDFLR